VTISSDQDIVLARQKGRSLALELGFSSGDATLIATAISELARNIVSYAGNGQILLRDIQNSTRVGISVTASDDGPGIPNISQALRDGFSTSGSLGLGLPGGVMNERGQVFFWAILSDGRTVLLLATP